MLKEAFHFDDYSYDSAAEYDWTGGSQTWNSATNELDVVAGDNISVGQGFGTYTSMTLPNSGYLKLTTHCSYTAGSGVNNGMGYWIYIQMADPTDGLYFFGAIGDDWVNYAGVGKQVNYATVDGNTSLSGQITVTPTAPAAVDIDTVIEVWWSPTFARMLIDGTINQEEIFATNTDEFEISDIVIFYNEGTYALQKLEIRAWDGKIGKNGNVNHYNFSEVGPVDELIGYWPMNGDANDYNNSGFQRHGTVSGASLDYTAPRDRACYDFATSTDKIDLSGSITFSAGAEWSWSFWGYKVSYGSHGIGGNQTNLVNGRILFKSSTLMNITTTGTDPNITVNAFPTNTWFHCVITHASNNEVIVYRDGISVGTADTNPTGNIIFNRIGDNPDDSGWTSFSDLMFDFRVYNKVLTSQEINILADMFDTSKASKLGRYAWNTFGQFKEN